VSPKKDYGSGELLIGAASVAQGTFLLIDETTLEPGQLEEQGVKNVQAIHALIGAKELVAGTLFGAFLATSATLHAWLSKHDSCSLFVLDVNCF
jgi:hypothetical protein